eukprot:1145977-Pelagomonas_calceolata.AAC.3
MGSLLRVFMNHLASGILLAIYRSQMGFWFFKWTLRSWKAFKDCGAESFGAAMKQGTPISTQDFTDDLRHRLCGVERC